jgi:hypothetical protein
MPSQKPQLCFVVDPGLIARLDDFRFQHRFRVVRRQSSGFSNGRLRRHHNRVK